MKITITIEDQIDTDGSTTGFLKMSVETDPPSSSEDFTDVTSTPTAAMQLALAMLEVAKMSRRESAKIESAPCVHIVHNGVTPCIGLAPKHFPPLHTWVRLEDKAKATCKGCLQAVAAWV